MRGDCVDGFLDRLSEELRGRGGDNPRLVQEIRDHLDDAIEHGLAEGLTLAAAERRALERFGEPSVAAAGVPPSRHVPMWTLVAGTVLVALAAAAIELGWLKDTHPLGTQNLLVFLAAGILLNLTPGQDTLYILTRSISQGRRAGMLSAVGISSGCVVHTLAAASGISAVLATSATLFTVVRAMGAAYLMYLGIRMLVHRDRGAEPIEASVEDGAWDIYRAACLTNLLNPKVALFFLAFLPQFVAPAAESKAVALLFLGAIFITTGTIWSLVLAWGGAAISGRLRQPRMRATMQRVTGIVFVGSGMKLAATR